MEDDYLQDEEFLNDISPDVLGVLRRDGFFDRLDNLFCQEDPEAVRVSCNHTFERSKEILEQLGFDSTETSEIIAVLRANGACCDCEVLCNVVEESRFKANSWKAVFAKIDEAGFPEDFLADRQQGTAETREPL